MLNQVILDLRLLGIKVLDIYPMSVHVYLVFAAGRGSTSVWQSEEGRRAAGKGCRTDDVMFQNVCQ